MGKRIFLGGLLGSVIVFLMSSIFHMATRLGEAGIQNLPNEDAVEAALRSSIHEPGFYFFPGANMTPGRSKEQVEADNEAQLAKWKEGPTGILIYSPGGVELQFGKMLVYQFLFGLVGALMLAWVLAVTASATSYGTRVQIVTVAALFGGIVYTLPYWNWYGFPTNYVVSEIGTMVLSWAIAGLAMAAVVKKTAAV
jgi:hypothetical protein